jgi:hypothetical protein
LCQDFGLEALPVELVATMRMISIGMLVVDWLLISRMTDCAEKLQLILFIIFLNGLCRFYLGGGVDNGGRRSARPTVSVPL